MKNITSRRRRSPSALLFGAVGIFALLFATTVEARPWGGGGRGGRGRGQGMGRHHRGMGLGGMGMRRGGMGLRGGRALRCTQRLFHQDPAVLQTQLGVSPAQIKKIHGYRNNLWLKTAKARGKMATLGAKMRIAMDEDVPNEGKVLGLMRQLRSVRGTIIEEHLKAGLWALKTLTAQQRATLRQNCNRRNRRGLRGRGGRGGRGNRGNRGGRGGRGMGRGMGGGSGRAPVAP